MKDDVSKILIKEAAVYFSKAIYILAFIFSEEGHKPLINLSAGIMWVHAQLEHLFSSDCEKCQERSKYSNTSQLIEKVIKSSSDPWRNEKNRDYLSSLLTA